jgi:hypothetical protein
MNRNPFSIAVLPLTLATALAGCLGEASNERSDTQALVSAADEEGAASETSSELALRSKRHCNVVATATRVGEPVRREENPQVECFDTFSEAIFAATKEKLKLAPDVTPENIREIPEADQAVLATYLTSIEYVAPRWDAFWGTWNFINEDNCDNGTVIEFHNMQNIGMNDKVSSAWTAPGCAHAYHYEHPFYGGAVLDCPSTPVGVRGPCYYGLGAMNDHTSSIYWTN